MVSITHTSPKYDTYQANVNYLDLLNIKEYLFLNIEHMEVSIPLEKKNISNTSYFDLITPINFQMSIGDFFNSNLVNLYELLQSTNAVCFYIQTKDVIDESLLKLLSTTRYRKNYYFNLSLSKDEIVKNMKKDARQRLRKAINNIDCKVIEDCVSQDFFSNYSRISNVNSFSSKYIFTYTQFEGFSKAHGIKYIELRSENEFIAGGFFGVNCNEIDYLYGASSEKFVDSIRLLIWTAINYFKNRGYKKLFLGGGVSENDSLSTFKSRLGTYEQNCHTIMGVLNKEIAERYANVEFNINWFEKYFPPYR